MCLFQLWFSQGICLPSSGIIRSCGSFIPSFFKELSSSKNLQTINAGEDVEKREPSCTDGGKVN